MSLISKLKEKLFPADAEPGAPPSWIGRLQEAKYVSLSGVSVPFQYLDLSAIFPKKTAVFESVNADGVYVQDNGVGGARFPMLCYFSGDSHDIEAATMIKALLERGEGTLYHPIFGKVNVVPFGDIEYVSALATAANQTSFSVEFIETTGLVAGDVQALDSLLDAFQSAAAAEFAAKLNVDDVADKATFKAKFERAINKVSKTLGAVQGLTEEAQSGLSDISDSINRTIDVLIGQPLTLARQTQMLILEPARIARATRARLEAYANMARDIFGISSRSNGYDYDGENEFHGNSLIASGCVAGAAVSSLNNDFQYSSEFSQAITELGEILDEFSTWSDDTYTDMTDGTPERQDTGGAWLDLSALVRDIAAQLIVQSFDATKGIRITLDRDRGMMELCFELYGTASHDQLEQFIRQNALGGDEHFLIKQGREIVYYP